MSTTFENRDSTIHTVHALDYLELQSELMVKHLLSQLHPDAPSSLLYESAAKVAASARQAAAYEQSCTNAVFTIQPLLTYYTVLHWMKTLLFLMDLSYPSSSSVLQHGVSVRRSKRHPFRWPFETVYVYKDGVLQSFCGIACPNVQLSPRLVIGDLLGTLPQLADRLGSVYERFQHVYLVQTTATSMGPQNRGATDNRATQAHASQTRATQTRATQLQYVPRKIASNVDLTIHEWRHQYCRAQDTSKSTSRVLVSDRAQRNHSDNPAETEQHTPGGIVSDPPGLLTLPFEVSQHPWSLSEKGTQYLMDGPWYPHWLAHFVLLYSLSSLCRYNPLEWSDILTWNNEADAYFVREYLSSYPIQAVTAQLFLAMGLKLKQ